MPRQVISTGEAPSSPLFSQAAGATLDDVVEVGILLSNPEDFSRMNEEYARWFPNRSAGPLRRQTRR